MIFEELLKTVWVALLANKGRSILTMLGVIIGVFAVISLTAVGTGVQLYITNTFNSLGSDLILISPGKVDFGDDPSKAASRNKLDDKHLDLIREYAGDVVQNVTPSVRLQQNIEYKTKVYSAGVIGGTYEVPLIFNYSVEKGRFFSRSEEKSLAKVVVIGTLVRDELFGAADPIGKSINIGSDRYEVIGISKSRGPSFDDSIVVPYTSIMETLDIKNFSGLALKAKDLSKIRFTMKRVELALLRDLKEDEFSVLSQEDILNSIQSILGMLTIGIGAIAGISLLVGGIGIMNIMLVSVTERIKEIGLRKALGATPFIILAQFMFEAVLISVFGGILGISIAWLVVFIASFYITMKISLGAVLLGFLFSVAVGVVFGVWPAYRASKLDPIVALQYE